MRKGKSKSTKQFAHKKSTFISNNTKNTYYEIKPEKNFYVFCKRNQKDEIKTTIKLNSVKLPVKANDVVGKLTIYNKGVEIGSVNLVSVCDINKLSYFENVKEIIADFHNTEKRYRDFIKAVEADKCGRAASVQKEIIEVRDYLGLTQYKFPWEE